MRRLTSPAYLVLPFLLLAVVLTFWVFRAGGAPLPGDVAVAKAIQRLDSPFADVLFRAENTAGDLQWLIFPAGALFVLVSAFRRRATGPPLRRLVAALLAASALRTLGPLLKAIVHSPRPAGADGIQLTHHFSGYGFPSGHVFGNVLLYGWLAMFAAPYLPRRLALLAQALLWTVIALSGPARIYAGAHWPSDTLGGYLWGAACLLLAATVARRTAYSPAPASSGEGAGG